MNNEQKNREFIQNLISKLPGFRGNEDLFDEIINETIKKSSGFLEGSSDISSVEIYIKKIAINVIVATIKNADTIRAEKQRNSGEFEYIEIKYATNNNDRIIYDVEIPIFDDLKKERIKDDKMELIKEKITALDKDNPLKNYKKIFELRFLRNLNNDEISKKLEIKEKETINNMLEIFKQILAVS